MPSSSSRKIVVRFNFWSDPAMEERFAREPDIELRTCDLQGTRRRRLVGSRRGARLPDLRGTGRAAAAVVRHGRTARALPQAALRLLHGRRLRHGRCRSLHQGRCPGREPGRRQRAVGRRAHDRPDARRLAADQRRRSAAAAGARLHARGHHGPRDERQGRGPGRDRPYRRRVAGLARAFGMTVLAFDPYLTEEEIARRGADVGDVGRACSSGRTSSRCTARGTTARAG